jgi:hypothetical protein
MMPRFCHPRPDRGLCLRLLWIPGQAGYDKLRSGYDKLRAGHNKLRAGYDKLTTGYDKSRARDDLSKGVNLWQDGSATTYEARDSGFCEAAILSIRRPSRVTTSKRQSASSMTCPWLGSWPRAYMSRPARVL